MPAWAIALVVLGVVMALIVSTCLYLYRFAFGRNRKTFMQKDPNVPQLDPSIVKQAQDWFGKQPFERVEIGAEDGITLRGHYLEAEDGGAVNKAVVLAHGYSGRGEDMTVFAHFYRELGYTVLMPDNRGHGSSGGRHIGFGWPDRKDYVRWIRYLVDREGKDVRILLHGVSMGGGTVLMTSGEPLPEQVKGIVSDCAYSSLKGILTYQLKQMFRLPAFPFIPLTSLICKLRAGFFFGEASVVRQVRKNSRPILLIHGGRDAFVPPSMADELYEAIRSPKERLIVAKAQHGNSLLIDPEGYRKAVAEFAKRCIDDGVGVPARPLDAIEPPEAPEAATEAPEAAEAGEGERANVAIPTPAPS
ncbi:alpha/beta hydrolase [Cohnella algarum]|uniref:alpha/beta hydrolase n=1 Tax=Cohnella algarum TaxID=2044859 RepID=UPI00196816FC|nr:alpha/beta hydrolase [Cohnella algarum]MBN2980822.1 alpha/beta hydrolase [Cohnella algarum]